MTACLHISRVKEWGFNEKHDFIASLWDCVLCGQESPTPFKEEEKISIDHAMCDKEPCFGCKAKGLQLNTGDASSQKVMSNKKWDGELNEYRKARAQGIQPAGTTMAAVQEAYRASEAMGKAYDADVMPPAQSIQKQSVSTLTDAGAI
jgi:hypothetical protein